MKHNSFTVFIRASSGDKDKNYRTGTGFAISRVFGKQLVMTCNHVIAGKSEILLNGVNADIVYKDSKSDVAILMPEVELKNAPVLKCSMEKGITFETRQSDLEKRKFQGVASQGYYMNGRWEEMRSITGLLTKETSVRVAGNKNVAMWTVELDHDSMLYEGNSGSPLLSNDRQFVRGFLTDGTGLEEFDDDHIKYWRKALALSIDAVRLSWPVFYFFESLGLLRSIKEMKVYSFLKDEVDSTELDVESFCAKCVDANHDSSLNLEISISEKRDFNAKIVSFIQMLISFLADKRSEIDGETKNLNAHPALQWREGYVQRTGPIISRLERSQTSFYREIEYIVESFLKNFRESDFSAVSAFQKKINKVFESHFYDLRECFLEGYTLQGNYRTNALHLLHNDELRRQDVTQSYEEISRYVSELMLEKPTTIDFTEKIGKALRHPVDVVDKKMVKFFLDMFEAEFKEKNSKVYNGISFFKNFVKRIEDVIVEPVNASLSRLSSGSVYVESAISEISALLEMRESLVRLYENE